MITNRLALVQKYDIFLTQLTSTFHMPYLTSKQ